MSSSPDNAENPDNAQSSAGADESAGNPKSDGDRGNLDGTTATNEPREDSLEQAQETQPSQQHGNGAFDDAEVSTTASDAGESGQDNGSMS